MAFSTLLWLSSGAPALAQVDFSEVVTFGDSLTDNEQLGRIHDVQQPVYGVDPIVAVFNKVAGPADRITDLAVAGAPSRDIAVQITDYQKLRLKRQIGAATLVSLQTGGNDFRENIDLLTRFAPGKNRAADMIVDRLISRIQKSLSRLSRLAPDATYILWTLQNITEKPYFMNLLTDSEKANLVGHIARVNAAIRGYAARERVLVFDVNILLSALVAAPPELLGVSLTPPPAFGAPTDLFADDVHPSGVTNGMLANGLLLALNARFGTDYVLYSEVELAALAGILQPE